MPPEENQPRIQKVNPADLRPSPICREQLSDEQLELAHSIHNALSPFVGPFEQFELGFLRDLDPDNELQVWAAIAVAFGEFDEQNENATDQDRQAAFTSFLMMSMAAGRPDQVPESIWRKCEIIVDGLRNR